MNIHKRYRFILAVFLTALYAFIATPVQLWHHHNFKQQTNNERSVPPFAAFSKATVDAEGGDCSICSHHYSVYADDASFPVLFIAQEFTSIRSFDQRSVADPLWFWLSNKGPPALS